MPAELIPTALVLIDCQKGFDDSKWGLRNNPQFEENAQALLATWRQNHLPVIHIRHSSTEDDSPLAPDSPGFEYYAWAVPQQDETEFIKHVNSGFIETGLEAYLRSITLQNLVVCGLTTNHCVSTTVRMAGNLGFHVELVADACATFPRTSYNGTVHDAELIHDTALASLHGEFCEVRTTQDILKPDSV